MIEELTEIRWDVRPAPHLGTLENRVCDGVSDFDDLAALVALMHCLVVDLDTRLAAGETLPTMPPWHVQENKWRAARYGLDAIVILDAESNERLVTDDLADLLERLAPVAERLGCAAELAAVADIPRARRVVPAAAGGRRAHRRRPGRGRRLGGARAARRARLDRARQRSVAALGLGHLQPDAEQPHRPVVLDPVEQRDRGVGQHVGVVGRRGQGRGCG